MNYGKLQWLFPIAVALHNGEEAIWMPSWTVRHAAALPLHPPPADEIRIALLLLTLAAFGVTYLSVKRGPESLWAYLTFGSIAAVLINVLVPHVPATVFFRTYAPGVATAVIVNLPLMTYLLVRAVRERWVQGWKAVWFALAVPLGLAGLILLVFSTSLW